MELFTDGQSGKMNFSIPIRPFTAKKFPPKLKKYPDRLKFCQIPNKPLKIAKYP